MNILMFTNSMCMDGVTTCVIDFANYLAQKGNKVIVCGKQDTEVYRLSKEIQFINIDFYVKHPKEIVHNIKELLFIVKKNQIDLIHCHWRMCTLYAKLLCMFTKTDFIWQNHLVPIPYSLKYRLTTFYGKKAIAISTDGKQFLHEKMKIPYKKIEVINNGINISDYVPMGEASCKKLRKRWNVFEDEKVIVVFSRLEPIKGHKFLLESLANFDRFPFKVLLTGEGGVSYKEELSKYAASLNILEKVVFTGNVKATEVLSIADVMVLPSLQEGFPISVIEAFALKVPVIRTKEGGFQDMQDCVDGLDYGDTEEMCRLLEKNLSRDFSVEQRIEKAYRKAKEVWDISKVVDNYIMIYES